MCMQCATKSESYGEFIPGLYLVKATQDCAYYGGPVLPPVKAGQYGIVLCNDPFVWFDLPMGPQPPEVTDEEDGTYEIWMAWFATVEHFDHQFQMGPEDGFALITGLIASGFNPAEDGRWDFYLHQKLLDAVAKGPLPEEEETDELVKIIDINTTAPPMIINEHPRSPDGVQEH